jgi:hypothetical protein
MLDQIRPHGLDVTMPRRHIGLSCSLRMRTARPQTGQTKNDPFAAVGKAAVNNLDLAPEALVALAENNIDRLRIAGHDARSA